jgi:hypothetical protein
MQSNFPALLKVSACDLSEYLSCEDTLGFFRRPDDEWIVPYGSFFVCLSLLWVHESSILKS